MSNKKFVKWYNLKSRKYILKTAGLLLWDYFTGLEDMYLANLYLKTTFIETWWQGYETLN